MRAGDWAWGSVSGLLQCSMSRCEPYAILVSSLGSAMVDTEVKSLCGVMGAELHDWGSCCYMGTIAGGYSSSWSWGECLCREQYYTKASAGREGCNGRGSSFVKGFQALCNRYSVCRLGWENLCVAWTWMPLVTRMQTDRSMMTRTNRCQSSQHLGISARVQC